MIKEEDISVSLHNRIPFLYKPVEEAIVKLYDWTTTIHTDIPSSTLDVMRSDIPKIYVGLHKSLWEAMGVPVVIHYQGAKTPYVVIGKNLVKGVSKPFMKSIGCIYVERAAKDAKKQDLQSALEIKKKIIKGLEMGIDISMFPTDGRSKDGLTESFYSTPFDAILQYVKSGPAVIIPFDVDYPVLNDLPKMLKSMKTGKSYTFRIWHFPDWWKDLGDVYVNFGEPIEVKPTDHRKTLNRYTLDKALDTVKILKINALSEAILRINSENFTEKQLINSITDVIEELRPQEHKFIGFRNADDIMDYVNNELDSPYNLPTNPRIPFNRQPVQSISSKELEIGRTIYANYIAQYFKSNKK